MRVIYKLNDDICVGKTYIENDTSVLFDSEALRTEELGFTLSLGDNLRFMIEVSYKTGRLFCMTCFLQGMKTKRIQVENIKSHRGQVFLKDEDRTKYSDFFRILQYRYFSLLPVCCLLYFLFCPIVNTQQPLPSKTADLSCYLAILPRLV